jgi:hypothetical protein
LPVGVKEHNINLAENVGFTRFYSVLLGFARFCPDLVDLTGEPILPHGLNPGWIKKTWRMVELGRIRPDF